MTARALLPCPFCGGRPELRVGYHAKYDVKIGCTDCEAEGALFGADDYKGVHGSAPYEEAAIAAWNRRASSLEGQAELSADDVQWIVNDNAELGVKIGEQCFFLYKGSSLIYEEGTHDDGSPMHYRTVGKREFGECCYPINHQDYSKHGTVSLEDSDRWQRMPAARTAQSKDKPA